MDNLPKAPDQVILELIIRALAFFKHAVSHSAINSPVDRMLAIHGLDNAVEHFLRIIIEHLDIEGKEGKNLDTVELASLAGEVNTFLKKEHNINLPYITEIKKLRQVRNLVQHGIIDPMPDLKRFEKIVDRFFDKSLKMIFDIDSNNMSLSSIIRDGFIKNKLLKAEKNIINKKYLESIVASRDAFENAYYKKLGHSSTHWSFIPAFIEAKRDSKNIAHYFDNIREEIEIIQLGVDINCFKHFNEYLSHIPLKYKADTSRGGVVMQRPWQQQDAEFCYHFVVDIILKWQNSEFDPLYIPKSEKEYLFTYQIHNITIPSSIPCLSYLDEEIGDYIIVLDVDKTIMEKIKVLEERKIYKFSYDIHVNSELDSKISKQIKLLGESIRLLTNNPARWEIAILYENIPLSWKRQDFKNNKLIKETPCINSASTEEIVEIYPDIINFKLAQEIVKYRENVGPIQNIEDLKRIPGINDQQIRWIADFSRAIP